MNRRNFLTRSGLALGALIVGDEVLEAMDRLTHRKVWALGDGRTKGLRGKWRPVLVRGPIEWRAFNDPILTATTPPFKWEWFPE